MKFLFEHGWAPKSNNRDLVKTFISRKEKLHRRNALEGQLRHVHDQTDTEIQIQYS